MSPDMGTFISTLRKEKGLTQRQLAEQINVTDKAVSKWERGMGYPDISLLAPLATALGVSTNELLDGQKDSTPDAEKEKLVKAALQYAGWVHLGKSQKARQIAKVIFTLLALVGMTVCAICDFALTGTLTWALYPLTAIPFGWLVVFPALQVQKAPLRASLLMLTCSLLPFLYALNLILVAGGADSMLPLAIPCAAAGLLYAWCLYGVVLGLRHRVWLVAAIISLLTLPFNLVIDYFVAVFLQRQMVTGWDFVDYAALLLTAAVFFYLDARWKKATDTKAPE